MEICCVGGFEEVGKNMTAIKVGEDVFLIDCGFYLPGVIELQENNEIGYTTRGLRRVGGIPDDRVIDKIKWRDKVKAIFLSHAHLDHVAGLPFLIDRYPNATVFGTPFTMKVLDSLVKDAHVNIKNQMKVVQSNSTHSIPGASNDIKVEFVHTTHSTIDSTFVVLHTPEGSFFYALDYKFDDTPTMGPGPNYTRLKEIGENGVKAAIINTLYSGKLESNGSEKDADDMLERAFHEADSNDSALFVTTFSSHIERLNNIVKHAQKTGREVVFLGRSLAKYVECAQYVGKCPFRKQIKLMRYRGQVNSILKRVNENRGKYVVVCTGHQGEQNSILDRISKGQTNFTFKHGDHLIYSSSIIPTEVNIEARRVLDDKLKKIGVNLQVNVHVHGHGSQTSKKKLIELVKPKILIPAHGTREQEEDLICVANEYGYKLGETSYLVNNGQVLKI
ncbi:MAG: MBL fold metallo-hydrolase [Nanoarchaeota archaeon]|jgi:ribonuclease J|nr:MBL fold metallo-hydrolase [Nanoarchaeota archaeon]